MAVMSPILRLRRAFGSMSKPEPLSEEQVDEVSEEAADAISEYGYSRRESDLMFQRDRALSREQTERAQTQMEAMRKEIAEFKTQVILAIMIATGLIIGSTATAVTVLIAVLD